jgi:lipid-A-disaccharide synthase
LETALFGVPEVVCYFGSPLTYQIAKRLVKVPYISLVNLIMEKMVVKELIQHEMNPENLCKELKRLLEPDIVAEMKKDYEVLNLKLMFGGKASENAAKIIHEMLLT